MPTRSSALPPRSPRGVVALGSLAWWLRKRKREGKAALLDPDLFTSKYFRLGISSQTLPSRIIRVGFLLLAVGVAMPIPIVPRAHSGYSDNSKVLSPAEQQQVSKGLEKNAEVMTNTQLEMVKEPSQQCG